MPETGIRRRGQRGVPRRSATPPPPPGAAKVEPSEDSGFLQWERDVAGSQGTYPEYLVWGWLQRRGLRNGADFLYTPVLGGLRQREGIQVDFFLFGYLAWQVNGIYWHYRTPQQRQKNVADRELAEGLGLLYVEILEEDVLTRIDATLQLALNGVEQPGVKAGIISV